MTKKTHTYKTNVKNTKKNRRKRKVKYAQHMLNVVLKLPRTIKKEKTNSKTTVAT